MRWITTSILCDRLRRLSVAGVNSSLSHYINCRKLRPGSVNAILTSPRKTARATSSMMPSACL